MNESPNLFLYTVNFTGKKRMAKFGPTEHWACQYALHTQLLCH